MKTTIKKLVLGLFVLIGLVLTTNNQISYAATGSPTQTISDIHNKKNHNFNYAKKIPAKTKVRGRTESTGEK